MISLQIWMLLSSQSMLVEAKGGAARGVSAGGGCEYDSTIL